MRPLDIGIIGAGTVGAAAGILLARQGHRITVYERVPNPTAVGAGILLQPTGQAALARLGLREAVVARCAPVDQLRCVTHRGRTLFRLRYDGVPGAHQGYGMHRGVLFEHLFRALRESGAAVRTGVEVKDLAATNARDGLWFVTPDGQRLGPHELCVVADGARSQLHDDTHIRKRVSAHAWGALWFVGRDRAGSFTRELHQVVRDTRQLVGALPTGLGPGDAAEPLVSLFTSIRADAVDAWRARGLDAWKREVLRFMPAMGPVLAEVTEPEQVLFSRYADVAMFPWNTDRVVYLGDAAHAMSPQLGQGANLALCDAVVLADAVSSHEALPAALDAYSRARRAHLGFYQPLNRFVTLWFQSDWAALGWVRDALMPWMLKVPPLERFMVRSMTGLSQGTGLGAPLLLPGGPEEGGAGAP